MYLLSPTVIRLLLFHLFLPLFNIHSVHLVFIITLSTIAFIIKITINIIICKGNCIVE